MTPPQPAGHILVLEPNAELASKILGALKQAAPAARTDLARNLEEAQRFLVTDRPDLFVLDLDWAPDLSQDFLYDLRTSHPDARAIILTGVHLATHREQAAGLGAIHFLEKPFPHADFVDLVHALLSPTGSSDAQKFQGTLSDLHLADIIQLKCMSGASATLQFTGPQGEKAYIYFENGQVRHATAPGKEGIAAFNEIVNWKGGKISEVYGAPQGLRTIELEWQILLMEAVRYQDEAQHQAPVEPAPAKGGRKILVIDDSLMLLSFVKEMLSEAKYEVATAATGQEALAAATNDVPDLVLLDYILPDMRGNEVARSLLENSATAHVPIVYMSGFGGDLQPDQVGNTNIIGALNKPFTSPLLLETVEKYLSGEWSAPRKATGKKPAHAAKTASRKAAEEPPHSKPQPVPAARENEDFSGSKSAETTDIEAGVGAASDAWWNAPASPVAEPQETSADSPDISESASPPSSVTAEDSGTLAGPDPFFAGDTSFFSLYAALRTIRREKLTGTFRAFWQQGTIEVQVRDGEIILVTTRDPRVYCSEAPSTLADVDARKVEKARTKQRETGCPFFLTLAHRKIIRREPAMQLVQHYGQKLFSNLWTAKKVRFAFEQREALPDYCKDLPGDADLDQWGLATLRCIPSDELIETPGTEPDLVPAYTRDGYKRVQNLRLTAAEAQFASQFNGDRSLAQIAKNLRLDLKLARLSLFRFLALEVVECWSRPAMVKPEKRGFLQGLGKSLGFGD